eukprot:scaffold5529_cov117-Cylindrotheca_fusiformis.AAC.34
MSATNGVVETTSSASLNDFSPISTLERQGAGPLGQRLVIGLQANASCWLEGGVESILKLKRGDNLSTESAKHPALNFEENSEDDFDAFAFLQESGEKSSGAQEVDGHGKRKQGIGGFFRKVAASASTTLERQMQGLAVRIDQGRNPDLLRVGMYDADSNELLALTESMPMPSERQDLRFEVPLTLPARWRQKKILLKLWIQSGAALLQSTKAARNYLLATTSIDCAQLSIGIQAVPLTSKLVVGGKLELCVMPDPKFSQVVVDRNWSLTDPDTTAYASSLNFLPLDQSYAFKGKEGTRWLMATERATESTIVLPVAASVMELAARASLKSLHHAQSVAKNLRANRHDSNDPSKSTCSMGVVGVTTETPPATTGNLSISWRRPDSMFELELLANHVIPISGEEFVSPSSVINLKFHPKLCTEDILPGVLNQWGGRLPQNGYLLGSIYFCLSIQSNDYVDLWEANVALESYVNSQNNSVQVPLLKNGLSVGNLLMQIQISMPTEKPKFATIPSNDGLVSLVGLENLAVGVNPVLDADATSIPGMDSLRHQQLATMGYFFTVQYMEQHLSIRQSVTESFQDRARAYKQALLQPETVSPHQVRSPKSFRPSASRSAALLSAIPFNVHVSTLNINEVNSTHDISSAKQYQGASFHNVTHGAPSDHARGFGNVLAGISSFNVSGGLRRLEKKRVECAGALEKSQNQLIAAVGNYLATARKIHQVNHIPARHAEIQGLRWKVFECVHNLHHVTWMCAVRRANVFSQSLGLALSSYLTTISDIEKCAAGWPDIWRHHGYMVCFEGLLSAAGKELGMIEDASVAIKMLRMVRVVIMPDNGQPSKAVSVPGSPFLKWVNLFASGQGSQRQFLLQVGVDQAYYRERVPAPIQNGTAVQFYPVLYQVGVDIRQWGAHAGSNLLKQNGKQDGKNEISKGLVDDEDDDVGVVDDDVLVSLNFEALQKMNAYAHAINPQQILLDKVQQAMNFAFAPHDGSTRSDGDSLLPVHPSLSLLHSHIISSAGKMNHAILDEAATLAQQLGGGGLVFCKSGKDRTAMHVTYKQAQFAARYRDEHDSEATLRDATLMRIYGVRLPICEKNVGQAKYAFNALQASNYLAKEPLKVDGLGGNFVV